MNKVIKNFRIPLVFIIIVTLLISGISFFQKNIFSKDSAGQTQENVVSNQNIKAIKNNNEQASKLLAEGFKDEDIQNASMFLERIKLQLQEIISVEQTVPNNDINLFGGNSNKDDIKQYKELSDKVDYSKALYYLVKLKNESKNTTVVMDEYLLSLQLSVDFDTYLKDKKEYEKLKNDAMKKNSLLDFITVSKIETKMVDALNSNSEKNKSQMPQDVIKNKSDDPKLANPNDTQNLTPQSIMPKNPTNEVRKEMNDIRKGGL